MFNKITPQLNYSSSSSSTTNKSDRLSTIKNEISSATIYLDVSKHLEHIQTKTVFHAPIKENIELRNEILDTTNQQLAASNLSQLYLQRSRLTNADFLKLPNLNQSRISYIDISSNKITKIPDVIFTMPALTKIKYEPNEYLKISETDKQLLSQLEQANQYKIASESHIEQNLPNTTLTSTKINVHNLPQVEQLDLNKCSEGKIKLENKIEQVFSDFTLTSYTRRTFFRFLKAMIEIDQVLSNTPELIDHCKQLIIPHVISNIMRIGEFYTNERRNYSSFLGEFSRVKYRDEPIILPILFIAFLENSPRLKTLRISFDDFRPHFQNKLGNGTLFECKRFLKQYDSLGNQNGLSKIESDNYFMLYKYSQQVSLSEFKKEFSIGQLEVNLTKFYLLSICQELNNLHGTRRNQEKINEYFVGMVYESESAIISVAKRILECFSNTVTKPH